MPKWLAKSSHEHSPWFLRFFSTWTSILCCFLLSDWLHCFSKDSAFGHLSWRTATRLVETFLMILGCDWLRSLSSQVTGAVCTLLRFLSLKSWTVKQERRKRQLSCVLARRNLQGRGSSFLSLLFWLYPQSTAKHQIKPSATDIYDKVVEFWIIESQYSPLIIFMRSFMRLSMRHHLHLLEPCNLHIVIIMTS